MNRNEFSKAFASEYEISQAQAKNICDSVLDFLSKCIINEKRVALYGFGVFEQSKQKGRSYVLNGNTYNSDDRTIIKFRPSFDMDEEKDAEAPENN